MPPNRRFPFQGPRPVPSSPSAPPPLPQQNQRHSATAPSPVPPPAPKGQSPAADTNPLQALLHRLDGDTLLILAVLLLLSKEQTDRKLLLALAYIIL